MALETPLWHGVLVAPPDGSILVQDILLVAVEQVWHDRIMLTSRMTRAVVLFMEDDKIVFKLVEN